MERKLYNIRSREILEENLKKENTDRITLSFYQYIDIKAPNKLRDKLYADWEDLNILGRIYIAKEGINAQISMPKPNLPQFIEYANRNIYLEGINIKYAIGYVYNI